MKKFWSFPFLIFSLILIHLCIASAGQVWDDIQIIKDKNFNVILKTSCSLIAKATENLSGLGTIIQNGERCEVNLNNALPEKMIQMHDTFLNRSGPNCWDTSLFMSGTLEFRRTVLSEEMDFITSSPICRPLTQEEKPMLGDLIAVHHRGEPPEFHGFNYINEMLAFSKAGFDKQFGYEIVSSDFVYTQFALGKNIAPLKCRRVIGVPDEAECPTYAQYFHCQNRTEYLANSNFKTKNEFLIFDKKVRSLEKEVSESTVDLEKWSTVKSIYIKKQISKSQKEADIWLSKITERQTTNDEYFFWMSTRIKLDSLETQIGYLDKNDVKPILEIKLNP